MPICSCRYGGMNWWMSCRSFVDIHRNVSPHTSWIRRVPRGVWVRITVSAKCLGPVVIRLGILAVRTRGVHGWHHRCAAVRQSAWAQAEGEGGLGGIDRNGTRQCCFPLSGRDQRGRRVWLRTSLVGMVKVQIFDFIQVLFLLHIDNRKTVSLRKARFKRTQP